MSIVRTNVKNYIEYSGRSLNWISNKTGFSKESINDFLNGQDNGEFISVIETLFGLEKGFFEEGNFDLPQRGDKAPSER